MLVVHRALVLPLIKLLFLHHLVSRKDLKRMMEHATQFPGEYSKVAGVTQKVNGSQHLNDSGKILPACLRCFIANLC